MSATYDHSARLLSPKQVCARAALSRSTIARLVETGKFPKPVRITEGRIAFVEDEVSAWIHDRISACREEAA